MTMGLSTRRARRALDLGVALVGLVALVPALPLIALALKIDSRGPLFFRDLRVGQQRRASDRRSGGRRLHDACGNLFHSLRFRVLGPQLLNVGRRRGEHPQLTRVGRWLRRTGLEDWPQLWNVLLGHMALVGPRAITPHCVDRLCRELPALRGRATDLEPGLFGHAQAACVEATTFFATVCEKIVFDQHYRTRLAGTSPRRAVLSDLELILASVACRWRSRRHEVGTDVIRIEYPRRFRQADADPGSLSRRMPSDLGGEVLERDGGYACWWYPPHRPALPPSARDDEVLSQLSDRLGGGSGEGLVITKSLHRRVADGVDVISAELPCSLADVHAVSEHLLELWQALRSRSDDEHFAYTMSFLLVEGLTSVARGTPGSGCRLGIEIEIGREQLRLRLSAASPERARAPTPSRLPAAASATG